MLKSLSLKVISCIVRGENWLTKLMLQRYLFLLKLLLPPPLNPYAIVLVLPHTYVEFCWGAASSLYFGDGLKLFLPRHLSILLCFWPRFLHPKFIWLALYRCWPPCALCKNWVRASHCISSIIRSVEFYCNFDLLIKDKK